MSRVGLVVLSGHLDAARRSLDSLLPDREELELPKSSFALRARCRRLRGFDPRTWTRSRSTACRNAGSAGELRCWRLPLRQARVASVVLGGRRCRWFSRARILLRELPRTGSRYSWLRSSLSSTGHSPTQCSAGGRWCPSRRTSSRRKAPSAGSTCDRRRPRGRSNRGQARMFVVCWKG